MTAIQELFVALDGSARSLGALPVASAVARRAGARVTAVLVSAPWRDCGPALAWLDANVTDPVVGTIAIVAEDTAGSLLQLAAESPSSVLCMTSHGRTGPAELALGSISSAVVRESRRPVLLVGPRARVPQAFPAIEVCVHGPPARVAGPAAEWAVALHATPWLVAVQEPDEVLADDTPSGAELTQVEGAMRASGLRPEVLVLHAHDPAAEILRHAGSIDAALVVASTQARRGVEGLLLGSVAKRLVREAVRPVVLVGPSVPVTDAVEEAGPGRYGAGR